MPKWLLSLMNVQVNERHSSKETDNKGQTISERKMGAHSVRYNGVCKECNSGWMNNLENETKPILTNLIYQQSGQLTQSESLTLANWLYKTLALYQLTGPLQRRRLIAQEDLAHFYRYLLPSGESTVCLCRITVKTASKIRIFLPRMRYGFPKESLEKNPRPLENCFQAYLHIGNLLIGYSYRTPPGRWSILRENDMPDRQQLWPTSAPVTWLKSDSESVFVDPETYFVELIRQN
jgi:hypothetical protein